MQGLKKGDVFEHKGQEYEVKRVDADGVTVDVEPRSVGYEADDQDANLCVVGKCDSCSSPIYGPRDHYSGDGRPKVVRTCPANCTFHEP